MCHGIGRSEVNSWELVLCFNHMRPRLGDRCLSLLSHVPLTTPPISLFKQQTIGGIPTITTKEIGAIQYHSAQTVLGPFIC